MLAVFTALAAVLSACAAPPTPTSGGPSTAPAAPTAPKVLNIAVQRPPAQLFTTLGQPETSVGGATHVFAIPHDYLVVQDDKGNWLPRLAQTGLSTSDGTWVLNDDGTMDTTWKLRPDVKWHDGQPFTSDDMLFTFAIFKDREIPNSVGGASD